jgi:transcriptional regulator of acetoin/glycerol metabolism
VVERAVILARSGQVRPHHLPTDLQRTARRSSVVGIKSLAEIEADHIAHALEATGGNIKQTAELLGISRTTLYAKIKSHGLDVGSD